MGLVWLIGLSVFTLGSILINLGTNLIKLGHNQRMQSAVEEELRPPVHSFKSWRWGTVSFITGNLMNFIAFGYAAQSLLSAMGSVQFISNTYFATYILGEVVTDRSLYATVTICVGLLILIIFGSHKSEHYSAEQLRDFYFKPAFLIFIAAETFVALFAYYLYREHRARVKYAALSEQQQAHSKGMLPVTYSIVSAALGSQSVLMSKSLSTLVRHSFTGEFLLSEWFTYVVLGVFVCSAAFWLSRLNKGLRMFSAVVIVPLMQIMWILFSTLEGFVYFEEYRDFTGVRWSMAVLGICIIFSGIWLLVPAADAHVNPGEAKPIRNAASPASGYLGVEPEAGDDEEEEEEEAAESPSWMSIVYDLAVGRSLAASIYSLPDQTLRAGQNQSHGEAAKGESRKGRAGVKGVGTVGDREEAMGGGADMGIKTTNPAFAGDHGAAKGDHV